MDALGGGDLDVAPETSCSEWPMSRSLELCSRLETSTSTKRYIELLDG